MMFRDQTSLSRNNIFKDRRGIVAVDRPVVLASHAQREIGLVVPSSDHPFLHKIQDFFPVRDEIPRPVAPVFLLPFVRSPLHRLVVAR